MTDRAIEIWTEALGGVIAFCIPSEIREQVLSALLEEQKERGTTAKPFKLGKLDPEKYHAKKEALSLMIQVMTRSITNNFSKEDAAKVLFRGPAPAGFPTTSTGCRGSRSTRRNALTSRIQPDPAGCAKP